VAAPLVSVVVPTYGRPDLVLRAVSSALAQTLRDLEVIVVVDGRDRPTLDALRTLDDARLHAYVPDRHLGNADALNWGVQQTRAAWIAFLDDDDAWLPEKLERQLWTAENASCPSPLVCCRIIVRTGAAELIWPRRMPYPGEHLSEYFFCRRTPFTGEGMITSSTILTRRTLAVDVPFSSGLPRHVDSDWVLRACERRDVRVEFVPGDPLTVWYMEPDRPRITTRPDWKTSFEWARDNRRLFTARGYAAFLLHVVGFNAGAQRAWTAFPQVLREACTSGRPAAVDLASYVANFLVPSPIQQRAAAWYGRRTSV